MSKQFNPLSAALLLTAGITSIAGPAWAETEWRARWAGPYAGVTLGLAASGAEIDRGAGVDERDFANGSASLGAFAGYSFTAYEAGDRGVLVGVEVDVATMLADERKTDAILGTASFDSTVVGSARLRAGYAWRRTHLYGTAGLAFTDASVAGDRSSTEVRAGLALGVGVEYAFADHWSARLEGITYAFGEDKETFNGVRRNVGLGASTIRFGLTRRF